MAEKSADCSKAIEIWVDLDYYFEIITGKVIKGKFGEPVTLKSSFRYLLSGQCENQSTVIFNETYFLKIHIEQMLIFSKSLLMEYWYIF